jgi:hypothetical protein
MQLQPISQSELEAVEGGMMRLPLVEIMPTPDPTGGMGYTGKMMTWSITVIDGGVVPC